jgi:hypothetical protein
MKLIRLQSDNNQGKVYNTFHEDITIEKNSTIALQNISFSLADQNIEIDNKNDVIVYTENGVSTNIELEYETYSKMTQKDLLQDIQDAFNTNIIMTNTNVGKQYKCYEDGSVIIESRTAQTNKNVFPDFVADGKGDTFGGIVVDEDEDSITNTNPILDFETNLAASYSEMGKNCSYFRTTITKLLPNTNPFSSSGFIIGLSYFNPLNDWPTNPIGDFNIPITDRGSYIRVHDPTTPTVSYRTVKSGPGEDGKFENISVHALRMDGDHALEYGNTIEIRVNNNYVTGYLYNSDDLIPKQIFAIELAELVMDEENENYRELDLFPYIIMYGTNDILELKHTRVYMDPYENDLSDYKYEFIPLPSPMMPPFGITDQPKNMSIKFKSSELAKQLGFNDEVVKMPNNQLDFYVKATNKYKLSIKNPYFLVVARNIHITSYDAVQGGRFNILACIPFELDNDVDNVNWESQQLLKLDIKNETPRSLRDIQIDIFNADLSRPVLDGMTSLVLIIEST